MKKLFPILIGLGSMCFNAVGKAENLLQVYQQAHLNNPELRKSAANRNAAFKKIDEIRGQLLPQLRLSADYTYTNGFLDSNNTESNHINTSLQLTQTLFDMPKWHALTLQEKNAVIQDVIYQTDQQQLILNTATSYLQVLSAIDALIFIKTQKQTIQRQLYQTIQRFNVGLIAITDVQNVRVQYSNILANEVTAHNNLDNALESLYQITGNYYQELSSLNMDLITTDKPQALNKLLRQAENRNMTLLYARLNQDLAREQIRQTQDRRLPTMNINISTTVSNTSYSRSKANNLKQYDNDNIGQNKVSLSFFLPLYQGGTINSQVKQAQYNFISASEQLESVHRNIIRIVHSSFNNIKASISNINAFKKAAISAQYSLDSMKLGYSAGIYNIVDVLNTTTILCNAKQQLSKARYQYLINQLHIKRVLGTLNEQDLQILNNLLDKPVSILPQNLSSIRNNLSS